MERIDELSLGAHRPIYLVSQPYENGSKSMQTFIYLELFSKVNRNYCGVTQEWIILFEIPLEQ